MFQWVLNFPESLTEFLIESLINFAIKSSTLSRKSFKKILKEITLHNTFPLSSSGDGKALRSELTGSV